MTEKICRVCLENKFKNFSISEQVIGKDLSKVIENVIGQEISKLEKDFLVCQECVVALIQAESIAAKLRRALDTKALTSTPAKTSERKSVDNKTNGKLLTPRNCISKVNFLQGKLTLACETCGFETNNVKRFKKHLLVEHQINDPRIFQCPQCDVAYQRKHALEAHIACLHENKPRTMQRRKSMLLEKPKSNHQIKTTPSKIPKSVPKATSKPIVTLMKRLYNSDSGESDGTPVKSIVEIAKSVHHMKTVANKSPKVAQKTPSTTVHNTSESDSDEKSNFMSIVDIAKSVHQMRIAEAAKANKSTPKASNKTASSSKSSQESDASESDNKLDPKSSKSAASKTMPKKSTTKFAFKCEHCPYDTDKATEFKKHLTTEHHIEKPRIFKCSKCESSFQHKQSLEAHINSVHEGKPRQRKSLSGNTEDFAASIAEGSSEELLAPAKTKSGEKRKNEVNDIETPISSNTKRVRLAKLGPESIKSEPQKQSKFLDSLESEDTPTTDKPKSHKQYRCERCSFDGDKKSLRKHVSAEHESSDTGAFKCPHCNEAYQREFVLQLHISQAHQNILPTSPSKQSPTGKNTLNKTKSKCDPQKCVVCGKNFGSLENLRMHTDKCHVGNGVKNCTHCGGSFKSSEKYEKHIFSEKCLNYKLQCQHPLCNKRFSRPSKLERHMNEKHPIDVVNMEGDDSA